MVARQALPEVRSLADPLFDADGLLIFYDGRPQTACNVNHALDDQPTGQMYGGYYVDQGPAGYHNGALYSDPRIAMYVGMGKQPDARRRVVADLAHAAAEAVRDRPGQLDAGPVAAARGSG